MGTFQQGRPRASACLSRSDSRTPCIDTRPNSDVIVVRIPTTSTSPEPRTSCNERAESLPLLQETMAFVREDMTLKSYHDPRARIVWSIGPVAAVRVAARRSGREVLGGPHGAGRGRVKTASDLVHGGVRHVDEVPVRFVTRGVHLGAFALRDGRP